MLVDTDTAGVKKAITDTLVCGNVHLCKHKLVHLVLSISHISPCKFKSLQWQLDNSRRESITLTKAIARLFVWEPVDELLVTRQHSRSRWDRD